MPEGDTVFRQAAVLHAALGGKVLTASDFRVPSYATVDLSGRTVQQVIARGKHLLMQFGDLTVHSHLKMEGTWHVYHRDAQGGRPQWRRPAHTARCVLRTQDQEAVGFLLGELNIYSPAEEQERLGHLGPDLLGPDWDPAEATRRLLSAPSAASASRCSTSATSPASATSSAARSASWRASCPPDRWRRWPIWRA